MVSVVEMETTSRRRQIYEHEDANRKNKIKQLEYREMLA